MVFCTILSTVEEAVIMKLSEKIIELRKVNGMTQEELKTAHGCSDNAIQEKKQEIYEGIIIKESITDDAVIDLIHVHKVELWDAEKWAFWMNR